MTFVIEMRPSERVIIDTATLDDVFQRLGERGAEAYVMDAVESISDTLAQVDALVRLGRLAEIPPHAQRVSRRSADIGLTSLARVARDMGIAARRADLVAYRAVWERLVRIGDRSLAQVWEMPGLSL
ncbi:MAG: hypothetical protein KDK12_06175 [Rhodobacteraceae bacterium]|nr:hypothetical protein [Paracoccaceae bacterium]